MYFNVNFNVFFKLIKVHLLVSELYIYRNVRYNNKKKSFPGFERKALKKIFGRKRDEVTGEWRKLHNEDLINLYCSPNVIRARKSRRMRWAGHVARMREGRGVYRVLVGKPEGKRPLARPRSRWEEDGSSGSGMWVYGLDRAGSG